MKIVKYAGFTAAIILSLGIINQASSYTSAQVASKAKLRIVSESEDALIGLRVEESDITLEGQEITIPLTIKNHLNRAIQRVRIIRPDNIVMKEDVGIPAGASKELTLSYKGDHPSFVELKFVWDGGNATIKQPLTSISSQVNKLLKAQKEKEELNKEILDENIVENVEKVLPEDKNQNNKIELEEVTEKEVKEQKTTIDETESTGEQSTQEEDLDQ